MAWPRGQKHSAEVLQKIVETNRATHQRRNALVLRGLIAEAEEELSRLRAEIVGAALAAASGDGLAKLKGDAANAEKQLAGLRAKAAQGAEVPPAEGAKTSR